MSAKYCMVFCTCPEMGTARTLAKQVIERRLGACVNILPAVESVYSWEGEVQSDSESLMLVKTLTETYPALERFLRETHPYELPEVIAVPLQQGSEAYLSWVREWLNAK